MQGLAEQRVSPRKNLRTRVVFEDEFSDEFIYFLSTDVSLSGIFIESTIQFQEGTRVFLKFSLYEGDIPIQVTGQVMRTMALARRRRGRRKKNQKKGIGLRFIALKPADLLNLEKFVQG
jgi:hypothetical protein